MYKITKYIMIFTISVLLLGTTTIESATASTLTEKQKKQYYKQYVKIVDKAMEKKVGIDIGVVPMKQFQSEDWQEPKEFEKMIQGIVDEHLAKEREYLSLSLNENNEVTNEEDGKITKKTYVYAGDSLVKLRVSGNFETRLDEYKGRQLFSKLNNVSSQIENPYSSGTWKQTSHKISLIDGGRTYSIRIEGIYSVAGASFEKAFTIEFYCSEVGRIS